MTSPHRRPGIARCELCEFDVSESRIHDDGVCHRCRPVRIEDMVRPDAAHLEARH